MLLSITAHTVSVVAVIAPPRRYLNVDRGVHACTEDVVMTPPHEAEASMRSEALYLEGSAPIPATFPHCVGVRCGSKGAAALVVRTSRSIGAQCVDPEALLLLVSRVCSQASNPPLRVALSI